MPITRRSALAAVLAVAPARALWAVPGMPGITALAGRVMLPDGRSLGYADYGDPAGPLVLYFHGTPGSRLETALIAQEALECGVRIIAVDRPGLGLSSYCPGRRILDWPADMACLIAALGYDRSAVGVIGVSGGAPYALACLACMPDRITHVALVSGHTPLGVPDAGRGNQDRRIEFIARRPRIATLAIGGIIRRLDRRPDRVMALVTSQAAASDQRLLLDDPVNREGLLANLRAATRSGPTPIVADVTLLAGDWGFRMSALPPAPITVWQGGCDPIAPPSMGHYFQSQLAGSELFIDPAAGHVTMLKWHARDILSRFA